MDSLSKRPGANNDKIVLRPANVSLEPYNPAYGRPYDEPHMVTSDTDDFSVLLEYWHIVWRHKFWVLSLVLLGLLVAWGICIFQTPTYKATATLEIQGVQEPFSNVLLNNESPELQTQADLLSSQTMKDRVASKMVSQQGHPLGSRPDPFGFVRHALGLELANISRQAAIRSVRLEVIPSKQSRLLKIQTVSTYPSVAAEFANILTEEYIQRNMEERWDAYQNASDWLMRAQQRLKGKLEGLEQQLVDFSRQSQLVITSDSQSLSEEKLKQLLAELAKAKADRVAKQSVYESSLSSPEEALPEVLDNGPMGQYQVKLAELRAQLAELTATLTPEHYKIKKLQAQIRELELAREKERSNIIKRIRIEYEAATKREAQLEQNYSVQTKQVMDQAQKLIHYNVLKREAESTRQLYETTLQKGNEASIASALRASIARIVDPANPPQAPYSPNTAIHSAIGVFLGLGCGVFLVIMRARSDTTVGIPGALPHFLNVRELGIIPSAKTDPHTRAALYAGKSRMLEAGTSQDTKPVRRNGGTRQNGSRPSGLELVTWTGKISTMAEAYRSVMTSVLFSGENGDRPRVLVITSPSPQEGKTTAASNLAIALAEIGQRVLLIDGDMRLPRHHQIFDIANTWGLGDILFEKNPISQYTQESMFRTTLVPGLYVLPSGPGRTNLSGLLYSVRLTELISRLRQEFDMVIIDSAPVLSVPDARILGRRADAVILVFRAGNTTTTFAAAAAQLFEEEGTRILGTILNDWNPNRSPYGPYQYNYHSRYYHADQSL